MRINFNLSLFNNWNLSMFGSEAHAIQSRPQTQAAGYLPAEAYFGMPYELPTAPAIEHHAGPGLAIREPERRETS